MEEIAGKDGGSGAGTKWTWKWMRNGHGRVNQATDIDLNDLTFDQKFDGKHHEQSQNQ